MEKCPFDFNFDPATFRPGDTVSYRVPGRFGEFPFVGVIVEVHDDYVEISSNDPGEPDRRMKGTRESRPVVTDDEALGLPKIADQLREPSKLPPGPGL